MSNNKQKLELTWIGKNNPEYDISNIEPRILEEDPKLSNCKNDPNTENMIIHGDNLLALKALLPEYEGKIKCIYIDPPFNTGVAFEHYDDSVEHSTWLSLMRSRFCLLKCLLSEDGFLLVHLDDEEAAYSKIVLDECFGRENYLNTISLSTNDPSGFKATSSSIFSTGNYIFVYAKNKQKTKINKVYIEKAYDKAYSKVLLNKDSDYKKWKWGRISEVISKELDYSSFREAKTELSKNYDKNIADLILRGKIEEYALSNASMVFRTAAIGGGARLKRQATIDKSKENRDEIFVHEGEDVEGFYLLNGEQILFYENRIYEIDGEKKPGQSVTDFWSDISWTGIASEGGVSFKNGKKPEKLLKRCIEIFSNKDDYVLDSFLGSGTTTAVSHKMQRKYIGIEMGEQAYTHSKPRLDRIISGEDQGGVSKIANWHGGGGYKFYELAPSFIVNDEFGNSVIDEFYNDTKLIKAMCKLMNFTFKPSQSEYWKQGKGQGKNYLYVTTQLLTTGMVQQIVAHLTEGESLIICPKKFEDGAEKIDDRITIKKIPQSILKACHFGKKEYLLPIRESSLEEVDLDDDNDE